MLNKIKDFFYNFTDIIFAIILIVIIGLVLFVNLRDIVEVVPESAISDQQVNEENKVEGYIEISIPSETKKEQLFDILSAYELADSKDEFSNALNQLDSKLNVKEGAYKIQKGTSIDKILKMILQ